MVDGIEAKEAVREAVELLERRGVRAQVGTMYRAANGNRPMVMLVLVDVRQERDGSWSVVDPERRGWAEEKTLTPDPTPAASLTGRGEEEGG